MAVIAQNDLANQAAAVTLTRTVMSASDTFAYVQGSGQKMVLWNTTASPVNVTLTNATPNANTSVPQSFGFGGAISTGSGKVVVVPATSTVAIDLDDYAAYLNGAGAATLTGGTGVTAHLYV
jgi:hypothetical protein